jgi:hypothetical protein
MASYSLIIGTTPEQVTNDNATHDVCSTCHVTTHSDVGLSNKATQEEACGKFLR